MDNLLRYFTEGTQDTKTLATIGAEIETHFVDAHGAPISHETSRALVATETTALPWGLTIDLGRQLMELQIHPCTSPNTLLDTVHTGLAWLYNTAAKLGAFPLHQPVLDWDGPLLWEPDNRDADATRDAAFIQLDGRPALEELCRIAAVQFTFSVNPNQAIDLLDTILSAELHKRDYPNEWFWQRYIRTANANYTWGRYGGPEGFGTMSMYVADIARQPIIMRQGQICEPRLHISALGDSHEELAVALRNVWWYCRLRRYGDTLALEVRPFSRRGDDKIASDLQWLGYIVGF